MLVRSRCGSIDVKDSDSIAIVQCPVHIVRPPVPLMHMTIHLCTIQISFSEQNLFSIRYINLVKLIWANETSHGVLHTFTID